jgi:hypothetical protein
MKLFSWQLGHYEIQIRTSDSDRTWIGDTTISCEGIERGQSALLPDLMIIPMCDRTVPILG